MKFPQIWGSPASIMGNEMLSIEDRRYTWERTSNWVVYISHISESYYNQIIVQCTHSSLSLYRTLQYYVVFSLEDGDSIQIVLKTIQPMNKRHIEDMFTLIDQPRQYDFAHVMPLKYTLQKHHLESVTHSILHKSPDYTFPWDINYHLFQAPSLEKEHTINHASS